MLLWVQKIVGFKLRVLKLSSKAKSSCYDVFFHANKIRLGCKICVNRIVIFEAIAFWRMCQLSREECVNIDTYFPTQFTFVDAKKHIIARSFNL